MQFKPATTQSGVKHSTTELVRSLGLLIMLYIGSKGIDYVKSDLCYTGTILQRNYSITILSLKI